MDDGPWMSPKNLSTRDDVALAQLYRNGAVQPALPRLDSVLRPGGFSFINVLQARVFGGGPMVNNAIHLRIAQERWQEWRDTFEFPVEWDSTEAGHSTRSRLDLDISPAAARGSRGWRTSAFVEGARKLGLRVDDLDLSVVAECIGCGGCNVGCRFGLKTGGLHGPAKSGKPSYLERAMRADAAMAPQIRALRFQTRLFSRQVRSLEARDLAKAKDVSIRAGKFVLAAGPIASSKLLMRSVFQVLSPVGQTDLGQCRAAGVRPHESGPAEAGAEPAGAGDSDVLRVHGAGWAAAGELVPLPGLAGDRAARMARRRTRRSCASTPT